jgi:hypothetical protein
VFLGAMALSVSSSTAKTVMAVSEPAKLLSTSAQNTQAGGVLPLPVKPKFERSAIQRTKSRKPVKGTKISATAATQTSDETVVDEIATTSGGILDSTVESPVEIVTGDAAVPAGPMRVRKTGKANSRTNRRRALVMCLALGMVRPCASNADSSSSAADLRRTASDMPALRRTALKVPSTLLSQVSLATTMKQTNLLGEKEDFQKLTSLQ